MMLCGDKVCKMRRYKAGSKSTYTEERKYQKGSTADGYASIWDGRRRRRDSIVDDVAGVRGPVVRLERWRGAIARASESTRRLERECIAEGIMRKLRCVGGVWVSWRDVAGCLRELLTRRYCRSCTLVFGANTPAV